VSSYKIIFQEENVEIREKMEDLEDKITCEQASKFSISNFRKKEKYFPYLHLRNQLKSINFHINKQLTSIT
jgi:hypothetical protein